MSQGFFIRRLVYIHDQQTDSVAANAGRDNQEDPEIVEDNPRGLRAEDSKTYQRQRAKEAGSGELPSLLPYRAQVLIEGLTGMKISGAGRQESEPDLSVVSDSPELELTHEEPELTPEEPEPEPEVQPVARASTREPSPPPEPLNLGPKQLPSNPDRFGRGSVTAKRKSAGGRGRGRGAGRGGRGAGRGGRSNRTPLRKKSSEKSVSDP